MRFYLFLFIGKLGELEGVLKLESGENEVH